MVVKVHWATAQSNNPNVASLKGAIFIDPEPFLPLINSSRSESVYKRCYAFIESLKNAFVIRSPIDATIKYDRANKWLSVENVSQAVFDELFVNRGAQVGEDDPALVSCFSSFIFYADPKDNVTLNIWPIPLLGEVNNTRVVVGGYNISKWIRPIEWAFEIIDESKPVVVKRGDPLFLVVLSPKNNDKVELERVICDEHLKHAVDACSKLKFFVQKLPLNKCYEAAESFLRAWRNHKK